MGGVVIYHKLKGEGYSLQTSQKADFFHAVTRRLANGRRNSVNETKFFQILKSTSVSSSKVYVCLLYARLFLYLRRQHLRVNNDAFSSHPCFLAFLYRCSDMYTYINYCACKHQVSQYYKNCFPNPALSRTGF